MAILYDQYKLQNSTQIPQFVGSALPELMQTAGVLQERFDFTKNQMDTLDYAMRNSPRSEYDKKEYDALISEYKGKLAELAKGNPEDMTRQSGMMVRDYMGRYKHIADNYSTISKYISEEGERAAKGEIGEKEYQANIRRIQDTYQGLKYDPTTNQYSNKFSERGLVKAPDMIEKVNKILQGAHAKVRGSKVKGMTGDNKFIVESGSETKILTWNEIKDMVGNAINVDPELQSYEKQLRMLAPYMHGFSEKLSDKTVQENILDKIEQFDPRSSSYGIVALAQKYVKENGLTPKEALREAMSAYEVQSWKDSMFGLAKKGVVDERKSESSRVLSDYGTAKLKEADTMVDMAYTGIGYGGLKKPSEFVGRMDTAKSEYNALMAEYNDWLKGSAYAGAGKDKRQLFKRDEKGQWQDVTRDADDYRERIRVAESNLNNFKAIDVAAQRESGFNWNKVPAGIKAQAEEVYQKALAQANSAIAASESGSTLLSNLGKKGVEEVKLQGGPKAVAEKAKSDFLQKAMTGELSMVGIKADPSYSRYLDAIARRTNQSAESTTIKLITDEKDKKYFSEAITNLASGMGKDGALSFEYATGEYQGKQLSGDDYKALANDMEVVGLGHDKNGKTTLVVRAKSDIKGKKTTGEDLLVTFSDMDLDAWLDKKLGEGASQQFHRVGELKRRLNNATNRAEIPLGTTIENGKEVPVYASVKKEDGKWSVVIPTGGNTSYKASPQSLEGIINEIDQAVMQMQPKKK